jgi:hypothetical protein
LCCGGGCGGGAWDEKKPEFWDVWKTENFFFLESERMNESNRRSRIESIQSSKIPSHLSSHSALFVFPASGLTMAGTTAATQSSRQRSTN